MKTEHETTCETHGAVPKVERQIWHVCAHCGQALDLLNWDQVMHHSQKEHEPRLQS